MIINISRLIILLTIIIVMTVSCNYNNSDTSNEESQLQSDQAVDTTPPEYIGRSVISKKNELVFIYVTSPGCSFCTSYENIRVINTLKNNLSQVADSIDYGFLTMSLVITWDVNEGFEHINEFNTFDELLIGNNWFGTGGIKYLFEDMPGTPGVPQVIITKRTYDAIEDESGLAQNIQGIENEKVLTRTIGANRLSDWLKEGNNIRGLSVNLD